MGTVCPEDILKWLLQAGLMVRKACLLRSPQSSGQPVSHRGTRQRVCPSSAPAHPSSATVNDCICRDLGQTLIVVLDEHEDPSTIHSLITVNGIGNVAIICSGAPGSETPRLRLLQAMVANIRHQILSVLRAVPGSFSDMPRTLDINGHWR